MTTVANTTIDACTIIPRGRHPLIFDTFRGLSPGDTFPLVNDHDPKPLYYPFPAQPGEPFHWDYPESGAKVWKVRIGKKAA